MANHVLRKLAINRNPLWNGAQDISPALCEKWSGFFYVHRIILLSYTWDRQLKVSSERLGNEDKKRLAQGRNCRAGVRTGGLGNNSFYWFMFHTGFAEGKKILFVALSNTFGFTDFSYAEKRLHIPGGPKKTEQSIQSIFQDFALINSYLFHLAG